ncbi:hypothetical protein ASPTUDRAFT_53052 [Aspergillus tubingensis CBS 134.48]|uniref:Uncharacterized protein n=1 Tax=Aspergillus tubingensis (strain CBS 134.48) TaxID=767770 RepID=A0A1L9NQ90_ASPTC|nr:hypothetical protein ASPTUDRAFT_53052 [Aspergillus tubingensis CBS 134.48]
MGFIEKLQASTLSPSPRSSPITTTPYLEASRAMLVANTAAPFQGFPTSTGNTSTSADPTPRQGPSPSTRQAATGKPLRGDRLATRAGGDAPFSSFFKRCLFVLLDYQSSS